MAATTYDFTINQGETFSKVITWKDAAESPIDLTGYTATMHLRRKIADVEPAFTLTTENSRVTLGGAAGTVTLTISATDTAAMSGKYVYDLEMVNVSTVKRLIQGSITVDLEVTR